MPTDSRPLKSLAATSQEEEPPCTSNLSVCMRRTLVDGLAIIVAYAFIVYVTEHRLLSALKVVKFYGLFAALAFLFRLMSVELDQLTRVAGFQLGIKLFSVLG